MARHFTNLVTWPVAARLFFVTIIMMVMLFPAPALGQGAMCPDHTTALFPIPSGNWPGTMALCIEPDVSGGHWSVVYADDVPCGSGVRFETNLLTLNDHPILTVVPPVSMIMNSGAGKLSFIFEVFSSPFGVPYNGNSTMRIESFNGSGQRTGSTIIQTNDYTMTRANYDSELNSFGYAYYWAIMDVGLSMDTGGYFTIQVLDPSTIQVRDYMFHSFRVNDFVLGYPAMCELPGGIPPAPPTPTATNTPTPSTPTNTPTHTPTGTYEPTDTPTATAIANTPTFAATSPGGTFTPYPTSTTQAFSTLAPPSTPTRFPGQILPTMALPPIQLPGIGDMATAESIDIGLTPNATTQARVTEISGWISQTEIIRSEWMTTTDQAISWLDPSITTTTGISSPVEIRDQMVVNIAQPIAIFRGLSLYIPNIWPYLLLMLLMLAWIIFILLVKFGLAILSETMELLRKVWEAIPFIN